MEENDVIAEYIKAKYPELLTSIDFAFFKIGMICRGFVNAVTESFKDIDFETIKKFANEKMQESED